ncbi:hypothetical protein Bca52824_016881 [Brassica carinata]|uniref:Uncharacterized protein n=1 Tax=Brassica carinata TaxID=52824 RepID=A0A8X7W7Y5_BRACI|nr:hypothetical protein Bca52824_016881 [Brassica carinata]
MERSLDKSRCFGAASHKLKRLRTIVLRKLEKLNNSFIKFKGIRKLSWDLLDGLEGADVVPRLKGKELLEFECLRLQIRQFGVNEDPPDPMMAGAWYGLIELFLDAYNVSWTSWFSLDVFW